MIFLADENIPRGSILFLRQYGYTVLSIIEDFRGVNDILVMKFAVENNCVLLTFDKDFGTLIFKEKLENPCAVVLFRIFKKDPVSAGEILLNFIKQGLELIPFFTIIEDDGTIRQRRL